MPRRRPVLIIDGGSRGDIGVIRSLGWRDVPVYLLASDPNSPSVASRYVTRVFPFPGLSAPDEACLSAIRDAARQTSARPVMLATGDRALALMSRRRQELAEIVDHDLAPPTTIEVCLEKDRFAPVAAQLGLPVPETATPGSFEEARELADQLCYPVFVKPVYRAEWDRLPRGTVGAVKGERLDSKGAMHRLLDALEAGGASRFIIQQYVEGGDDQHLSVHAYILPCGTVAGTFTGVKLRIDPPRAGLGAHVLSRKLAEPTALAVRALGALGYTGFAIANFKRDARSGAYKLLEINCRYSTWTELPSRAGCNFPLAAYAAVVGERLPCLEQHDGISWLDVERTVRRLSAYGTTGGGEWRAFLRSLGTVRCWAYFAWDDPSPFFRKIQRW